MRNPLRNLVVRPSDKPSLRDRLAATRERWRRGPAAQVSPELARLVEEADRLTAAVRVGSDDDHYWPDQDLVRRSVEARAAVIRFPSHGGADTAAKLASLGRGHGVPDLREGVRDSLNNGDATFDDLALTVIAELLEMGGIGPATVAPLARRPDPIFAAIAEAERLRLISDAAYRLPDTGLDPLPEKEEAAHALHDHIQNVLLQTVPATAAGCVALVRFAQVYQDDIGNSVCEGNLALVALIARSPAL
ncbi:hypothetical protein [Methylorubrum thiocyanatum]|uniref:hypothetical protein n=1 Tax=Methylorubrum thiocyanatum TaxID=47958 RepID=UPI00398C7405